MTDWPLGRGSSDGDLDGSPALPQLDRCARVPSRPRRLVHCGGQLPRVVGVDLLVDLGVGVDVDLDRNGDVDWDEVL